MAPSRPRAKTPNQKKTAAVMLVDDHPMWRETVRKVIEYKRIGRVVAEVSDGEEAIRLARRLRPDVVVMDVELPTVNGIEATRRLLADRPDIKVLVLSASDKRAHVIAAVKAGASGYIVKTADSVEVAEAVRRIRAGELVFPPALAGVVLEELRETEPAIALVVSAKTGLRREGLARTLEGGGFQVLATGSIDSLRSMVEGHTPQVVVVEDEPGSTAGTALLEMREKYPEVGLLVLSHDPNPTDAFGVISLGSRHFGYLLSDRVSELEQLGDAIRRVAAGESVIDPDVVAQMVGRPREDDRLEALTEGERNVLELMAEGRSNNAIADRLHVSTKTVEARVASMFSKLGLEPAADDHRRVLAVLAYFGSR